jgi:hypothetical protein
MPTDGQQVSETAKCRHCKRPVYKPLDEGTLWLERKNDGHHCGKNPSERHEPAEATRIWDAKNLRWIAEPAEATLAVPEVPKTEIPADLKKMYESAMRFPCRLDWSGIAVMDLIERIAALEGKRA